MGGFDCDRDSDCSGNAKMRAIDALTCGNTNCPYSSWGSKDDCCVIHEAKCKGNHCYPYWGFDCDRDSDCSGNAKMRAIGALTCGNANCPYSSWGSRDDCCTKRPTPRPTPRRTPMPTQRPTPMPTPRRTPRTTPRPTQRRIGLAACTDGLGLIPASVSECPSNANIAQCDQVAAGELCEGDGECGT